MNLSERIGKIKSDEKKARLDSKKYLFGAFGSIAMTSSIFLYGIISPEFFSEHLLFNISLLVVSSASTDLCFSGHYYKKSQSESIKERHPNYFNENSMNLEESSRNG